MRLGSRFLWLGTCVLLVAALLAPGAGAVDGEGEDPSVPVPDVLGQFANLARHGDPIGFGLTGIGDDPSNCRHYQGIARVNAPDGTPFLILSRSGNDTGFWCSPDGDFPGELIVVRMGTRDTDGERLRSNKLAWGLSMEDTAPSIFDGVVAHVHLNGQGGWPASSHPGGMQAVGNDNLVVALSEMCPGTYQDGLGDCNEDLMENEGGFLLVDVQFHEEESGEYSVNLVAENMFDTFGVPTVAAALVPFGCESHSGEDRYLFAASIETILFHFWWSTTDQLTEETKITYAGAVAMRTLGEPDVTWEMINFVAEPGGDVYLIGAGASGDIAHLDGGEWVGLYKVDASRLCSLDQLDDAVTPIHQKQLMSNGGSLGSFYAATGTYVSPSGQLILYAAEHDNSGADGSVRGGEFRNINVYHQDTTARETMCPWVELYEDAAGWDDVSPERSLMLDYGDRLLDGAWFNLAAEGFDNGADSLRWYRAPGQLMTLHDMPGWGVDDGIYALHDEIAYPSGRVHSLADLDGLSWGDRVSSVFMSPFADPGGPYTGTVEIPVPLSDANPCLAAEDTDVAAFAWTVDSEACTFSDPAARQPEVTCDAAGTYELTVQVLSGLGREFTAGTHVTMTEPANRPPVAEGFSVTVAEDIAAGTTLGTVTGSDPDDDPLMFTITAGDPGGLFSIGTSTGVLTTAGLLDYETATQHVLTVAVSDGELTDEANVTVAVTDVDETPPAPPRSGPPADYEPFADDDWSIFEADIEWLAWEGITVGCNPDGTMFCPADPVTRAQMASFLVRSLDLPAVAGNRFTDVSGTHLANINALAEVEITLGCNADGTMFCPDDLVTRAQMGSFLARALQLDPVPGDRFDDVSGVHEPNINAIAQEGITLGCNAEGTRYCPDNHVTRGQMAAFLHRGLG